MTITAAITLSHDRCLAAEPASSVTLSGLLDGSNNPVNAVAYEGYQGKFLTWVTLTSTTAVSLNVLSMNLFAIPDGQTPVMGVNTGGAPIDFGFMGIGPTQVQTVAANGTLALPAVTGRSMTPWRSFGDTKGNAALTVPASWTQNTVYTAGAYVINPGMGGISGGGNTFCCVAAGTSSATGPGPKGNAPRQTDGTGGTCLWSRARQQVFDICAEIRMSDGSIVLANPTSGGSGTLTIIAAIPVN